MKKRTFRQTNKFGVVKIRRMSYTSKWSTTSKDVKKRDGNRCAICGSTDGLETHHIIPRSKGGTDRKTNLITLCERHHNKRHRHKQSSPKRKKNEKVKSKRTIKAR